MLKNLKQYYNKQGISARNFNCPHESYCRKGCDNFVRAREAMVGSEYEKHKLPRILFVSLDPGCLHPDPERRTIEFQRDNEIVEKKSDLGPGGKHWYETCELALRILSRFDIKIELVEIQSYFAHTNSAKCCENNEGNGQASSTMFENCKKYLRGEIEILDPDILVTQGNNAWNAVEHGLKEQEVMPSGKIYISNRNQMKNAFIDNGVIYINGKEVLWFHSYHPRDAGCYWDQKKACHMHWVETIREHL